MFPFSLFKKQTYKEFLQSSKWKKIRAKAIKRDGKRCRVCGSTYKLQVHHISYEDWTDLENLTTLCRSCHDLFHKSKGE